MYSPWRGKHTHGTKEKIDILYFFIRKKSYKEVGRGMGGGEGMEEERLKKWKEV